LRVTLKIKDSVRGPCNACPQTALKRSRFMALIFVLVRGIYIDTCYTLPGVLYRNENSTQYVSYTSTPLVLLVSLGLPKNSAPIV